ncbi:rhomboid family intramembrane serine protease [Actinomadura kijaniata]|uniref:Membrane associated rhomboid family serine protease n=1 Tax=Actinomadura namibiensis TaxID=182080 RepID=A0A7W3QKE1_ACTNM|nr:rhomboid family intramembrane serine protease [Actinomadura namibiensis]MBA8950429.1 membrane associated rhomboid family serine protease [Actinomadura namibiensis]
MSTDNAPETAPPTCYRHPGRETHVRCTRCDRYICPDCMRDASVGFQCVECVAEGNRGVRQPRTVGGARTVAAARPTVTYVLIAACVLVYLAELASPRVVLDYMMVGAGYLPGGELAGVAGGEWYRLFTSMFLHQRPAGGSFGLTHILFNMWALWAIGPALEQALGRWRFLALYLLAGLGGSVLLYVLAPTSAAVGASGAIFGLFAAFFVFSRKTGAPMGPIVFLLGLNLVITFAVPGISWEGHVGGLLTGGVLAAAYAYVPRGPRQQALHVAATAVVLMALVAAVLVKTAQLQPLLG